MDYERLMQNVELTEAEQANLLPGWDSADQRYFTILRTCFDGKKHGGIAWHRTNDVENYVLGKMGVKTIDIRLYRFYHREADGYMDTLEHLLVWPDGREELLSDLDLARLIIKYCRGQK